MQSLFTWLALSSQKPNDLSAGGFFHTLSYFIIKSDLLRMTYFLENQYKTFVKERKTIQYDFIVVLL